jgi:hypothetical protein
VEKGGCLLLSHFAFLMLFSCEDGTCVGSSDVTGRLDDLFSFFCGGRQEVNGSVGKCNFET